MRMANSQTTCFVSQYHSCSENSTDRLPKVQILTATYGIYSWDKIGRYTLLETCINEKGNIEDIRKKFYSQGIVFV